MPPAPLPLQTNPSAYCALDTTDHHRLSPPWLHQLHHPTASHSRQGPVCVLGETGPLSQTPGQGGASAGLGSGWVLLAGVSLRSKHRGAMNGGGRYLTGYGSGSSACNGRIMKANGFLKPD